MRALPRLQLCRAGAFIASLVISGQLATAQSSRNKYCDAPGCIQAVEPGDYPGGFTPSDDAYGELTDRRAPGSSTADTSMSNVPGGNTGGGFGNVNLISGSSPGDTFAAMAAGTYIDNAVIRDMFRFRFDAAFDNPLPDRAEFFYAQCGCFGGNAAGPLLEETGVDYQEFVPYFERALSSRFSLFAETPVRLINPDRNSNSGGFGDMNLGFKSALLSGCGRYLTAQFRVYVPTGDADRGLGTDNVNLEPGLLYLGEVSDRLRVQSEFRVWIPISDSTVPGRGNFAGPILRYGIGGGYDLLKLDTCCQRRRVTGTFEAVGWSITDGLAFNFRNAANPAGEVLDADGDTIVNLKSGLRYTAGRQSVASSYGFAVTGDRWYSDILRVEYRYAF